MFKSVHVNFWICASFVTLLLSACQPIRPEAPQTCSDADKLALLPTFADALHKGDIGAAAAQFLPDATFSFDVGPHLNPETGEYIVPGRVETTGREQYTGVFQAILGLNASIRVENPVLQGNSVTAAGGIVGPEAYSFGTPDTDAQVEIKITIQNCKIASYDASYPQAELDTFPAKAAELDKACTDDYKTKVFKQYIYGVNNGNSILAALPYAQDAHYEFQPIPVWSEADQRYIDPPLNTYQSLAEFKPIIDYFISIGLYKELDLSSLSTNGNTLKVKATLSSDSFSGDPWLLPVTEVEGEYTLTFNDHCKIANLQWRMAEGSADKLTALKKNQ